jgi:hypothetical protein
LKKLPDERIAQGGGDTAEVYCGGHQDFFTIINDHEK